MSIAIMREAIASVYAGPSWRWKVQRMSAKQVMAVYYSFLERGLLK